MRAHATWHVGVSPPGIGLGCMRLSTAPERDDDAAIEVIHAALDAGATLLDTADAYCRDQRDVGHNERVIARALATWDGDRSRITVATKGGMTRLDGAWVPDGRAKVLTAACDASRRALGVDRIDLYQLHAPDPQTPIETSVRALAALHAAGAIARIGLCNVTRRQLARACEIVRIDAVQVELNPFNQDAVLGGVVEYCNEHGIDVIAHRPLGGVERARRLARDPVFADIARRHGVTPHEIALAWLMDLDPRIVPIPGATRTETASSLSRAAAVTLTDADRAQLDERIPDAASLRQRQTRGRIAPTAHAGELVLVIGLPAAGKSTIARELAHAGALRLNRDTLGGSLRGVIAHLEDAVGRGARRIVADNTYLTRKTRAPILQAADRLGLRVHVRWLTTSVEEAQVNAVWRMLQTYGRLLEPEEIRERSKRDPAVFGPNVLFRYARDLEPPEGSEGIAEIEEVPFVRGYDWAFTNRGLMLWADGALRRRRSGARTPVHLDDLEVDERIAAALRRYASDGWKIIAIGWRPEIPAASMSPGDAAAIDARVSEVVGAPIAFYTCPHPAGPPICWCRKPLPGLGVLAIHQHRLDASRSIYVGSGAQDPGFARRLGFQNVDDY